MTTRAFQSFSGAASGGVAENYLAQQQRKRIHAVLERLEYEARRVFQLEAELSAFSNEYYEVVGEVTERLAEVEARLTSEGTSVAASYPMPEVLASRDAADARKRELKARYRQLAKEIHPDRVSLTSGTGARANHMHSLNAAYAQGDLAAMLKLEAEMVLTEMLDTNLADHRAVERSLREIERAIETYAESYRTMLNSPLNELMLRAMSARLAGWDWMQTVVKKVERAIEEKERAMIEASIAKISQWREDVTAVA